MIKPTLETRLALRDYPSHSKPIMHQRWQDLLFLHWEYPVQEIQKTLPEGLFVDHFQGKAYVGLTPFFMRGVKLHQMPIFSSIPDFMELNLRTYVYDKEGVPGVWFYSLNANNFLVVQAANRMLNLPYVYANMEFRLTDRQEIDYRCQRQDSSVLLEYIYKGTSNPILASPDSLEFFLVERYVLFAYKGDGQLLRGRVHHAPYPLSKVEVSKWDDRLLELDGLKKKGTPPDHMIYSPGVDVEIFNLEAH